MDDLDHTIFSSVNAEDEALLKAAQGEEHTFSEAYHRKMERLYRGGRKSKKARHWKKQLIATFVAATLLVGSVTAGAFWKEISAFFQSMYAQYADLRVIQKPAPFLPIIDASMAEWESYWYPTYLPDDYSFLSANAHHRTKLIAFSSASGDYLDFEQTPSVAVVGSDTEGTPVDGIVVGVFETFAFEKEIDNSVTRILIWSDGSTSFRLSGTIPFDEIVSVAEQIVVIEN